MRSMTVLLIGALLFAGIFIVIPEEASAQTWESKHLYSGQWIFFDVGTLDQGTVVEYSVRVTTPDESVDITFMDSTNYAAYSSSMGETFVGQGTEYQVRTKTATFIIPYQQQWYFVAESDSGAEIDIDYYVEVQVEEEETDTICGGAMIAGSVLIMGILGLAVVQLRKRR